MKQGRFSLPLVILLLLSGCKSSANQELLERDLRWQEDQIFALENQLEETEKCLESCRRENDSLRRTGGGGAPSSGPADTPPRPSILPSTRPPANTNRNRDQDNTPPALIPPSIQPGTPVPGSADPLKSKSSMNDGPLISPAAYEQAVVPADDRVTKIVLNRFITGGRNVDGCYGDEGIMVIFEPRNEADQLVPVAGEVSIAVLDPAQYGEASRVARWDYSADEVCAHYKKTALTRGFQFDLPWPNHPPINRDLTVYVRYRTADGRKLVAEKDIRIELPSSGPAATETADRSAGSDSGAVRLSEGSRDRDRSAASTASRPRWSPTR